MAAKTTLTWAAIAEREDRNMETADKIKYWNWCADKYWQYQRRQEWTYSWHGDVLVRYHELTMPDPEFTAGLIDWLKSPESVHGFTDGEKVYAGCTVYNRPAALGEDWKPVSAWYEQQEGQIDDRTKLKVIRIYQALQRNPQSGSGEGPFVMENGCMQKVSFTYHWKVAELPAVPQGESGVTYRLGGVSKDDETGMWTCYLEKRERVMQELTEYTSDNTDFVSRTEKQILGVKQADVDGTGRQASARLGVIVRRRVKKNEDCTSDVINETEVAKPVKEASVTVERTLRAKTTVTEDRNMSSPLSESDLKIGTRVRNEKTEAGLYNRQKTVVEPVTPSGPIKEVCGKTLFEHTHGVTEASASRPAKVEVDNVQRGDGETQEMSVRHLDDGTFEKETVSRKECKVENAVVETQKTLRGVRKITVNRSMDAPAGESDMKIGDRVRSELTPGGKYNQTIERKENLPIGIIAESKQETAHQSTLKTLENLTEKPLCEATSGDGKCETMQVRTTEEGTHDVEKTVITAKAVTDAINCGSELEDEQRTEYRNAKYINVPKSGINKEVSAQIRTNEFGCKDGVVVVRNHKEKSKSVSGGALHREVETTIKKNVENVENGAPAVNVEEDVDITINKHGSFDVRKRKVTHSAAEAQSKEDSPLYKEETTEKINSEAQEECDSEQDGVIVKVSNRPNEHGSFSTSKSTRTAKAKSVENVSWTTNDDNYQYTHYKEVYRNSKTVPTAPSGYYQCTMSLSINDYGLYDAIISYVARAELNNDEGSIETGTETKYHHYQKSDGKLYYREITASYTKRVERGSKPHADMMNGAKSGWGFRSHDNGMYGVVYSNITVGAEKEV